MTDLRILDSVEFGPPAVVGRHAAWLPHLGVKMPFQHGGRIAKYTRPGEQTYGLHSLANEVAILRALAAEQMAPPIGRWVYAKNIISSYGGAWRCDPIGGYGYEMAAAEELPPGRFDIEAMRRLPIEGSEGAWGDVLKPGNVVNGHLVDVRRSTFDMLRWTGPDLPEIPRYVEDVVALEARVRRDCQYPPGERPEPYQEFYLGGCWIAGARDVHQRAELLGFAPQDGESVLDIGCQSGGFLQYAWLLQRQHGALSEVEAPSGGPHGPGMRRFGVLAGVDIASEYITCARDLARANEHAELVHRRLDVVQDFDLLAGWMRELFSPRGVDHLLLLSMEKHIGEEHLWRIVDAVGARRTYLETNTQAPGQYRLLDGVEVRGGRYVGDTVDRNPRRLYRIER